MAKLTSDDIVRAALWEEYDKRCFWMGEPIEFFELEVDHLIRESLAKDPILLQKILKTGFLPADYDLQGLQNLVPSCRKCNGQKSAADFTSEQLIHLTMRVNRILPNVEKRIKSKKDKLSFDEAFIAAVRAEQNGSWKIGDLVAKFRKNGYVEFKTNGLNQFPLSGPIPSNSSEPTSSSLYDLDPLRGDVVIMSERAKTDLEHIGLSVADLKTHMLNSTQILRSENGSVAMIVPLDASDNLYIKYKITDEQICVLSCHMTID